LNKRNKIFLLALVFACASMAAQMLPRAQTPAADGKRPPDFTLTDQSGKPFHLAAMRGKRLLLAFYRGYW
jgi:cytochrome oxidase Cu insertion factor (SCO1/SenC/PrrC family)